MASVNINLIAVMFGMILLPSPLLQQLGVYGSPLVPHLTAAQSNPKSVLWPHPPLRLKGGMAEPRREYDSKDAEKFDHALWDILEKHPDEIHFLNTVFNFLQRRTPCFNGPKADRNYQILIDTLTHQQGKYMEHVKKGTKLRAPEPLVSKSTNSKPSPAESKPDSKQAAATIKPVSAQASTGKVDIKQSANSNQSRISNWETTDGTALTQSITPAAKLDPAEKQLPVHNGGTTDRYKWTQNLKELTAEIWLPPNIGAKQLEVTIHPRSLRVALKGSAAPPIIDGAFDDEVKSAESYWTVENGVLIVTLAKCGEMTWWKTVMKGDPEIDLQKIDPETSNLGDLNPDIRQTVEKMMYDQRQKALGLPTLDEKKQQDHVKRFMEQHPEMDFSKCKFN